MDKGFCSAFTTENQIVVNRLENVVIIKYKDSSKQIRALWDTGATGSCISSDMASSLNMISTGVKEIRTPSGSKEVNTYLVDVVLPNNVLVSGLEVCDTDIGKQKLDMLIGMDIISKGDFAVSNYNGKTVFTFRTPSTDRIDFAKQISVKNIVGKPHGKGKNSAKKRK